MFGTGENAIAHGLEDNVRPAPTEGVVRSFFGTLGLGLKILRTCVKEAPEFAMKKSRREAASDPRA
ncbi:MAG: hypothetical protein FLDDKLPJ_01810 [Phycisphaerae bacterium]|nr:hypothetical protein [Phycisphaerae bacterium]